MNLLAERLLQSPVQNEVWNYPDFLDWVDELSSSGKTSGPNQTAALVGYTALNLIRMRRIGKTLRLKEALKNRIEQLDEKQIWLVITEAWCGDSAQNLPVIAQIAEQSRGKIELGILLRDENPGIMDRYLTNGGRSIPKLIAFREDGTEDFQWGPRPESARQMFLEWKADPKGQSWAEFEKDLHTWYARNKSEEIQDEMLRLLL